MRQLAHKLSALDPDGDAVRKDVESQVLEKLWSMGILKQNREQGAGLSKVEREVTVSAFARRRLGVVMVRMGMVENVQAVRTRSYLFWVGGFGLIDCVCVQAVKFIEQGHIRVGTDVVTDAAFMVNRNMEDFVTWVDSSKIKRNIMSYRDKLDDFDLL